MKRLLNSHYLLLVTVPTLLVAACFFLLFSRPVSADSGQTGVMKGYEAVLVRDGDTLSSLACSYAPVKSHMSEKEYLEAVAQQYIFIRIYPRRRVPVNAEFLLETGDFGAI